MHFRKGPADYKHSITIACCLVTVVMHLLHRLSRASSSALLQGLTALIAVTLISAQLTGGTSIGSPSVPSDVRTAMRLLQLDPLITAYPCCPRPSCCKVFRPYQTGMTPDDDLQWKHYPRRCDNVINGQLCKAALFQPYKVGGKTLRRPQRVYHCKSVKAWVGEMLSRPGLESKMESYVQKAIAAVAPLLRVVHPADDLSTASDIWHRPFIHRLAVWPDKHEGFGPNDTRDLRLMFSMGIDWFNPMQNKQSGKGWSIGAIYLVCNNLPPDIRFSPENICLVGIIPGRRKPKGEAVNQFLSPIVDELVHLWEGVWCTQTSAHSTGRRVWGLLGPVICDLDAARGIGGLPHHRAHRMCSVCAVTRSNVNELRNPSRMHDLATYLAHVHQVRHLSTESARKAYLDDHGVGWSELLRLAYWNPLQLLVLDPMHNLFLGLFQRHCRILWGMDFGAKGWSDDWIGLDIRELGYSRYVLAGQQVAATRLKRVSATTLRILVRSCPGLPQNVTTSTKDTMVTALIDWVRRYDVPRLCLTFVRNAPNLSLQVPRSLTWMQHHGTALLRMRRTSCARAPRCGRR